MTHTVRKWGIIGFILAVAFSAPAARANGTGNLGVNLALGLALPDTSSSALAWSLGVSYKTSPLFMFQVLYEHYGVSVNANTGGTSVNSETGVNYYAFEPDYLIAQTGPGQFHLGLRLGYSKTSITSSATDGTNNLNINDSHGNLFIGPMVGYDAPIGVISVGGEAGYLLGLGDNAPKAFIVAGTAKFWF